MGALAKTIKTLKKLRSTFLKLARKFEASGMLLTDPRVTDDGHSVATMYLLDKNGNKTNDICIAIKYFSEDVGGGTTFSDVSFLREGDESRATRPLKGPLFEQELESAVLEQLKEWYDGKIPETTKIFDAIKKHK